jgi:hypothetical protein
MNPLKFVQWFLFSNIEVELVLVSALVAANQGLLFDGPVVLRHFEPPVDWLSSGLLRVHRNMLQFI